MLLCALRVARTLIAQWTTRDAGRPVVRWGRVAGRTDQENGGSFGTYTQLQMCGAPANSTGWVDPGWLNYAALTGLQPGMRYFYTVGDPVSHSLTHACLAGAVQGCVPPIIFQTWIRDSEGCYQRALRSDSFDPEGKLMLVGNSPGPQLCPWKSPRRGSSPFCTSLNLPCLWKATHHRAGNGRRGRALKL